MKNQLFIIILLLFPILIKAQWEQTSGPVPSCSIKSFAFKGNTIFAGTNNEYSPNLIYRSSDNGAHWEE